MYQLAVPVRTATAYKYRKEILAELRRCGATRVVLSLGREIAHRFSSEENLAKLAELVPYFRADGLEVAVWLAETLGHDRYSAPRTDCGYGVMRTLDGKDIAAFCPLCEELGRDIASWLGRIAKLAPDLIIIDDDFRMGDNFGCCCDKHLGLIRESLSETISIAELRRGVLGGGDNAYRRAYLKAQGEGLLRLARKMRAAVDAVDPRIRLGACITSSSWDADGVTPTEIADALAGKARPFIRLFGAPYHHIVYPLYSAVERERTQFFWLRDSHAEIATEGDTYPRPRYACPASYLECFDMILRADGGSRGIMKYMLDYSASPSYESGFTDRHVKNRPIYEWIEREFSGECVGFTPYLPLGKLASADLGFADREGYRGLAEQVFEYNSPYELLAASSLPSGYAEGGVKIVFGESARVITPEELGRGAIIDMDAARILTARGIDVGIAEISDDPLFQNKGFADLPYEYFPDGDEYIRLDPIDIRAYKPKPDARVLSRITRGDESHDFVYTYENSEGRRFLVLPFSARAATKAHGYFRSYRRKRQLTDAYEYIGGKPLDAYLDGDHPSLYTLVKRDGDRITMGFWNLFADKTESLTVRLSKMACGIELFGCEGQLDGDRVVITSTLYPYEFCAVKIY